MDFPFFHPHIYIGIQGKYGKAYHHTPKPKNNYILRHISKYLSNLNPFICPLCST